MTLLDQIDEKAMAAIAVAALDNSRVKGKTHQFYRYPARFSPGFVQHIIEQFTNPGDLVLDPFIGGGTTAVEARTLGRRCVGIDINTLAVFISQVKTTPLTATDTESLTNWITTLQESLQTNIYPSLRDSKWVNYHRNISDADTWRIRRLVERTLETVNGLSTKQENFARCAILRTSQWALDSKKELPTVSEFRKKLYSTITEMLESIKEFSTQIRSADKTWNANSKNRTMILNRSSLGIENDKRILKFGPPKLILTSPPYPGVHVLYHRWQVKGRRETPAPYWIANKLDGSGGAYYTLGDRKEEGLAGYFENTYKIFSSLAKLSDHNTTIVQMIAFPKPGWQLPAYLNAMNEAGFCEQVVPRIGNSESKRLCRDVPNRKWYTNPNQESKSNKEVVLFHKLA